MTALAGETQIRVSELTVEVVRKDIKNLHLAVYPPHGRVRVAAPLRIDDDAVRLFTISRLPWIRRQQGKYEAQERQSAREYVSGESHYVQGRRYLMRLIEDGQQRAELSSQLLLHVRVGSTVSERQSILNGWYRAQLKLQSLPLIEKWCVLMGLPLPHWGIKRMKTKWGSCNIGGGRIWLNLELARKPVHCLEYVVVHELAHFYQRRHNAGFRLLLDQHLPLWRMHRQELNQAPLLESEARKQRG